MSPRTPAMLLIEDDPSLQRFVATALDELPLRLIAVSSVDAGLAVLARESVDLILTDLMMPGRSGYDLIDALVDDPALRGDARIVVFSAGLDAQARQRLARPEVWRLLLKPCAVAALEACVRGALSMPEAGAAPCASAPEATPDAAAIDVHFGGDAALYRAFRATCIVQFRADIVAGDQAVAARQLSALHHLAHSLKSVLLMLGHPIYAAHATRLEALCAAQDACAAWEGWPVLRACLKTLVRTG